MEDIKLAINDKGKGGFYLMDGEERIGEMVISIKDSTMTVHHTEVAQKAEGKGFAKKLLAAMVEHARQHSLKVIPLCTYVLAQFKRHPDEYADVWNKNEQ